MNEYMKIEYKAKGIVRIFSSYHGWQLWVLSGTRIRKNHQCKLCKKEFSKGKTKMYRPITNLGNRKDRICEKCLMPPKEEGE